MLPDQAVMDYPQAAISVQNSSKDKAPGALCNHRCLSTNKGQQSEAFSKSFRQQPFSQCQISMTFWQHCDVCSTDVQLLDVLEVEGDPLKCAVHVQLLAVT